MTPEDRKELLQLNIYVLCTSQVQSTVLADGATAVTQTIMALLPRSSRSSVGKSVGLGRWGSG